MAVKPIEFQIQTETPYINLAVAVNYKLNAYKPTYENNYVPKHESRLFKLRTGAEDELTQIDSIPIAPVQNSKNPKQFESAAHSTPTDLKTFRPITSNDVKPTQIIDLVPSKQLSEPVEYSPMHIFVNHALFHKKLNRALK